MAVPKRKKSKSKRDSRRATHGISARAYVMCSYCDAPKLRHNICMACGVYRGTQVIPVVEVGEA